MGNVEDDIDVEQYAAEQEAAKANDQAQVDSEKTSQETRTSVIDVSKSSDSNSKDQTNSKEDADSVSNASSPTSPSSTDADTFANSNINCGNNIILDKRIATFRSNSKTIWLFFVDPILGNTSNVFTIADINGTIQLDTSQVSDEDSVLFMAKTDTESFTSLPVDIGGAITTSLFWAVYQDGGKYKPIVGAKYFTLHYDKDLEVVDLFFWANVLVDDLSSDLSSIYPDSIRNGLNTNGTVDDRSQRVLFFTQGFRTEVITSRVNSDSQSAQDLFIFSKPVLVMNPGRTTGGSQSDPVVDQMPTVLNFLNSSS